MYLIHYPMTYDWTLELHSIVIGAFNWRSLLMCLSVSVYVMMNGRRVEARSRDNI